MNNGKILSNRLIPKYVPSNLKWDQKDGLDTWHLQGKCNDFIENVDLHFSNIEITNFDMINNDLPEKKFKNIRHLNLKVSTNIQKL